MPAFHPSPTAKEWSEDLRLNIADSLFNNTSEGICITDAGERIIEVNPTFCKLSGYSKEELLGKTPRILKSGLQDRDFFVTMWADLYDIGQWHGELWNRNKTGELFAVRINISAICNGLGSVSLYLAMMADITAMKVQQTEWKRNANHDQLTALPNRILLMDRLHQAMAQSQRTGLILAICYLDLDKFKEINDRYGHAEGDAVLVELASRLQRFVREGDTVARIGGDEFILLLWGLAGIEECNSTLNRLLAEISAPMPLGTTAISMTASVGVSIFPQDGDDPLSLTAQADSAMYRAKVAGGNRLSYF